MNVVGLRTTLTPFDRTHSVMPRSRATVAMMWPGVGLVSSSGALTTASTYLGRGAAAVAAIVAESAAASGIVTPALARADGDRAVAIGRPAGGQRVHVGDGDPGEERPAQRHFVLEARQRFARREGADVLAGEGGRLARVLLREDAVDDRGEAELRAVELGRREPAARHALDLREQRLQTARDPRVGDQRGHDRRLFAVDEQRAVGRRGDEGRVGQAGQFLEACVHQRAEELVP